MRPVAETLFFCLATGALMGCAFLAQRAAACLLGLGALGASVLDALFGVVCGGFVFLCALAVDSGSLRLYQAALQGLGAWAAVVALGPCCRRGARGLRKSFRFLLAQWGRGWLKLRGLFPAGKAPRGKGRKKRRKNTKKQRKNT